MLITPVHRNLNAVFLTEYIVLFSRKALKMNQTCFSTFHWYDLFGLFLHFKNCFDAGIPTCYLLKILNKDNGGPF